MKRFSLLRTILILIVFSSCEQIKQKKINKSSGQNVLSTNSTIRPILVDYKSNAYKIAIGENYKISEKIIDWHWAALNDPDNKIDSAGKDAFLFLGEPLLSYNDGEWLPSLHIETNNNQITSFTCSILFSLADNPTSETDFLELLSKDILQLKNEKVIQSLKNSGFYEITKGECIETFTLTRAKQFENDKFEYEIKTKNGR